jgi:hypothetical protein
VGILAEAGMMGTLKEAQEGINVRLDAILVELKTLNLLLGDLAATRHDALNGNGSRASRSKTRS